jgi:hypothetical protein
VKKKNPDNCMSRATIAGLLYSVLCMLSACRMDGTNDPVTGRWSGRIIPLTLFDVEGRPYPKPFAAIKVEDGVTVGLLAPDAPIPPKGAMELLTRDGQHLLLFSEFLSEQPIKVSGTIKLLEMRAPGDNVGVDRYAMRKSPRAGPTAIRALVIRTLDVE